MSVERQEEEEETVRGTNTGNEEESMLGKAEVIISPKSRMTPSAAPVTSRFPLWLKAVQLMATGPGSREN